MKPKQTEIEKMLYDHAEWLKQPSGEAVDFSHIHLESANLRKADLYYAVLLGANFEDANLKRANLTDAAYPLSCGGTKWKINIPLAAQLAYHFCSHQCDDPDFIRARDGLLDLANRFHRAEFCRLLLPAGVKKKEGE